jgi:hypothetical protein
MAGLVQPYAGHPRNADGTAAFAEFASFSAACQSCSRRYHVIEHGAADSGVGWSRHQKATCIRPARVSKC